MSDIDHYEIQSSINKKFGAVIYPISTSGDGAGYYYVDWHTKKSLTSRELFDIAGIKVHSELQKDCSHYYYNG